MAVMPNTPSAPNVFRSAWMPAPPPESLPAMVSARGMSAPKVIPSSRGELAFHAARVDADEPVLRDLADVGERDAEPLVEHALGVGHTRRVDGGQELVVLAAGERELQRI